MLVYLGGVENCQFKNIKLKGVTLKVSVNQIEPGFSLFFDVPLKLYLTRNGVKRTLFEGFIEDLGALMRVKEDFFNGYNKTYSILKSSGDGAGLRYLYYYFDFNTVYELTGLDCLELLVDFTRSVDHCSFGQIEITPDKELNMVDNSEVIAFDRFEPDLLDDKFNVSLRKSYAVKVYDSNMGLSFLNINLNSKKTSKVYDENSLFLKFASFSRRTIIESVVPIDIEFESKLNSNVERGNVVVYSIRKL